MRDDTAQPDVPDATDAQTADLGSSEPAAPILLQDRWWWSPTLSLVLGSVIAAMQVSALRTGGVWLNWLVAAIGAAVAVSGLVRLLRAYARVRSTTS
jgi:hypothetical protein